MNIDGWLQYKVLQMGSKMFTAPLSINTYEQQLQNKGRYWNSALRNSVLVNSLSENPSQSKDSER